MTHRINGPQRDKVSTETFTVTTHHVHVELADLLGKYDPTEQVVVVITTPSGRPKRVTINGSFLVAPAFETNEWDAR